MTVCVVCVVACVWLCVCVCACAASTRLSLAVRTLNASRVRDMTRVWAFGGGQTDNLLYAYNYIDFAIWIKKIYRIQCLYSFWVSSRVTGRQAERRAMETASGYMGIVNSRTLKTTRHRFTEIYPTIQSDVRAITHSIPDGKNSTEPQKSTQKQVFWGLTKNAEKHFHHLGPRGWPKKTLKHTCFWVWPKTLKNMFNI